MLGTVAGVFISGILAVGVLIAIVGAVAGKSLATDAGIKKHSILHLKLDGALTERMQVPSLMEIIQGDDEKSVALDEVCEALTDQGFAPFVMGECIPGTGKVVYR